MNCLPSPSDLPLCDHSLTVELLTDMPALFPVLQQSARRLIGIYDEQPRVARLMAAQQKWLLTQTAYALHLERDPGDPLSGITAARLLDIIVEYGVASRNTATAFLAEMLAYKLIRDVPGNSNRRSRPLEPTEISEATMRLWFRAQMQALDLFDQQGRVDAVENDTGIFDIAQPLVAKSLIADTSWRDPPPAIGAFVWTESGGLLLDDLMSRAVKTDGSDDYYVSKLRLSEVSNHFGISRTHARRLFVRTEQLGVTAWQERGVLKISASLVSQYCQWQAIKLAALDRAYTVAKQLCDAKA